MAESSNLEFNLILSSYIMENVAVQVKQLCDSLGDPSAHCPV